MIPMWLKDTAVLTTIITACSGVFTVLLNKMFEWKSNKAKGVLEDISKTLCTLKQQVDGIDQTTVAINHQNDVIQDGTRKIQRYRLYHDLKREVMRGYTTLENYLFCSKVIKTLAEMVKSKPCLKNTRNYQLERMKI